MNNDGMVTAGIGGYESMVWRLYELWRWSGRRGDWPRGLKMRLLVCTIRQTVYIFQVDTEKALNRSYGIYQTGKYPSLVNNTHLLSRHPIHP